MLVWCFLLNRLLFQFPKKISSFRLTCFQSMILRKLVSGLYQTLSKFSDFKGEKRRISFSNIHASFSDVNEKSNLWTHSICAAGKGSIFIIYRFAEVEAQANRNTLLGGTKGNHSTLEVGTKSILSAVRCTFFLDQDCKNRLPSLRWLVSNNGL